MPNYRRAFLPGGTFFFTLVTFGRRTIFSDPTCVDVLRRVVRDEKSENPFEMEAAVNPVKHEYASCPHAWKYSSFNKWISRSAYAANWCCRCDDLPVVVPDFSGVLPDCE